MINKSVSIESIKNLVLLYKENYSPNVSEFTHIYTYHEAGGNVSFIVFDIIYDRCEIIDIFTVDKYRNKGIASILINEIIKDFDIENITLEVKQDNINAINLYEKLGFKKASIRKGYYSGVDGILMIKEVR